jgi:hypothetical protein
MESHSKALWRSWLARRPVTAEVAGSSPVRVASVGEALGFDMGAFRPGSSVGMSVRLKSGRSPVRSRPWPLGFAQSNGCLMGPSHRWRLHYPPGSATGFDLPLGGWKVAGGTRTYWRCDITKKRRRCVRCRISRCVRPDRRRSRVRDRRAVAARPAADRAPRWLPQEADRAGSSSRLPGDSARARRPV